jgi:hypothetical protein
VVVAGGREPPNWEAYPPHQFIHTIGRLPCCAKGGCWRSRSVPLGDGDEKDEPKHLCVDVVNNLPRCMHLITPDEVIRAIDWYFSRNSFVPIRQPPKRKDKSWLDRHLWTTIQTRGTKRHIRRDFQTHMGNTKK